MTQTKDAPQWMTEAGLTTLKEGYLLPGETVQGMWHRIAKAASARLGMPELYPQFVKAMNDGYICLASPVLSNMGTDRGLPISCFGQAIGDSIFDIYSTLTEFSVLSKHGGGVSQYWGFVRPSGSPIKHGQNGASSGTVPFAKSYDATVTAVSQGSVRRGANAFYWPASHGDRHQALRIRRPLGSVNHQCLDSNHAFIFTDSMMEGIESGGNVEDRKFWGEVLRTRIETGEPYVAFEGAMNRLASPRLERIYSKFGLKNLYSNICTEIILPADLDHTFVCCISSLPIHRYREWKGKGIVRLLTFFLDAVIDEFIEKASKIPGFERAVRFAEKSRAIGIGALGWHTFLQNEGLAFNSPEAAEWNRTIFSHIRDEAEAASRELAQLRGEPEWCRGEGYRNTHLMAIAPTATNSIISGHVSPGIEPWSANIFAHKTVKGSFVVRNPSLERVLDAAGKNTDAVWKDINNHEGSVQHLDWLPEDVRRVYLTAYEMDMHDLVDSAAGRAEFIDQGQSLNFFFSAPRKKEEESEAKIKERNRTFMKYVNSCHLHAWKAGLKTIYYARNKAAAKADTASRTHERRQVGAAPATAPAATANAAAATATASVDAVLTARATARVDEIRDALDGAASVGAAPWPTNKVDEIRAVYAVANKVAAAAESLLTVLVKDEEARKTTAEVKTATAVTVAADGERVEKDEEAMEFGEQGELSECKSCEG